MMIRSRNYLLVGMTIENWSWSAFTRFCELPSNMGYQYYLFFKNHKKNKINEVFTCITQTINYFVCNVNTYVIVKVSHAKTKYLVQRKKLFCHIWGNDKWLLLCYVDIYPVIICTVYEVFSMVIRYELNEWLLWWKYTTIAYRHWKW